MSKRTFILAVTGLAFNVAACGSYGTYVVEVKKTPARVASVSITVPNSLAAGQTARGVAIPKDAGGAPLADRPVAWFTSSASIASVTASGMISAIAPGTALISALSEGKSASSALSVNAPPPIPVASVSVSPATATVQAGSTVQLTAVTRDVNNNVLTGRVVAWSSANTNIASVNSTSGLVTAGATGTAQITATSEAQSGSASVNVQAPPPPPPPGSSNEPAGMTLIDERPFNSLAEHAAPYVPAWDTDTSLSIVQDATALKSPSNVLRSTFPTGFSGAGNHSGHAGLTFGGNYRVLYISYWAKYSANWYGHESGINKHVYAWNGAYPPFVMEAEGTGSGPLKPRPILQRMVVGDGNYNPNLVPGAVIPRGVWFHIEIVLNGNTAGTANGSMDWWLDGVRVGSVGGLQWSTATTAWNIFEIAPVWGGVGTNPVPATMTLDWDNVYLSGKN